MLLEARSWQKLKRQELQAVHNVPMYKQQSTKRKHQNRHKNTKTRRPANPPARFAFHPKANQTQHQQQHKKGARPNKKRIDLLGRPVFTSLVFLVFNVHKTDPSLWRVEAKAVQTPPGTPELAQECTWQTRHPPLPPETKIKAQVSAKWRQFCKAASCSLQSLCVCRCCEEWLSYFTESLCAGRAGECAHIWEIVADKVASKPLLI